MTWEAARVTKAISSSCTSSFMSFPTRASSTTRPVMIDGSSPSVADSTIAASTSSSWSQ